MSLLNKFSVSSILIIVVLCLLQAGCLYKKRVDPWKEGELVTWMYNENFIVKLELGQRREHIPSTCRRCERASYRPEKEMYLGQFPIDYQPKKYALLSELEAKRVPFKWRDSFNGLEFGLMLNGSTVRPTDRSGMITGSLDHLDQVKVNIQETNRSSAYLTTKQSYLKYSPLENRKYDLTMSDKYGMQCHKLEYRYQCFGESNNPKISGLVVDIWDSEPKVSVSYSELIYGGIELSWYVHKDNLHQWKEIDANIWRLLETWNVSPITKIQHLIDNPREDLSKTDTPKAKTGEIFTLEVTPKLIVSVKKDETNPYNRKSSGNFLGQFPIEFIPSKPAKSDIKEVRTPTLNDSLKFVLFRNGLKDHYIRSGPSPNRVMVNVTDSAGITNPVGLSARAKINHLLKHAFITTDTKFIKNNLECYPQEYGGLSCVGQPKNPSLSEIYLKVNSFDDGKIFIIDSRSSSDRYGGIIVEWSTVTDSYEDWEEIEEAIWHLLDEINVAPLDKIEDSSNQNPTILLDNK